MLLPDGLAQRPALAHQMLLPDKLTKRSGAYFIGQGFHPPILHFRQVEFV